jgi:hypothetical protein
MNAQTNYLEKPSLVNVIAWTTLASGIVNLGWGLVASSIAFLSILGICCTPLTLLPAILGIFEIIYAAKLLSVPPQPVRPAVNLAVLEIVCILTGNVFSMIVGIISLIFYNDPAVKEYFARLNGNVTPGAVPSAAPQIPPVVPVITPAPVEEPIPSPISGEEQVAPAAPIVESQAEEPTPPAEEIPLPEPPAEPEQPMVSASDETMISSGGKYEAPDMEPEPPAAPEEPDSPGKTTDE